MLRVSDDMNFSKVKDDWDDACRGACFIAYEDICFTEIRTALTNSLISKNIEIETLLRELFVASIEVIRFLLLKILSFEINIEALKNSLIILLITLVRRLLRLIKRWILLIFLILTEFNSNEMNLREILSIQVILKYI